MTKRLDVSDSSYLTTGLSRREFVAGAGTAAVALSVVQPQRVAGSAANSKVDLAIIGCGGRGNWIADLFRKHGGYNIVAASDYFADRVEGLGNKFGVPAERRYTGLSGHRRLLEQKLDAVAIESPPYFHPVQAADAVAAGKHVYLAKPIAVDVPGCMTIQASGKKATADKRCFLVDFQTRANGFYIEALRRVHDGAIGTFAFGESTYHAGIPWKGQIQYLRSDPDSSENRLRAWGLDRVLSGDIITEQNIHTLDVASWIMGGPPECAYGTGGQKVRDFGTCWDTFSVVFQYPDNVGVAFSSRQFNGHGSQPEGIRNRMFGTDGVLEAQYGGQVLIRGKQFYRGGATSPIFKEGVVNNIATFHDSIQKGECSNPTVEESVRSNLVTILGRTAAYEGRVVTWDELMRCDEPLEANLKGLKD
jgi:predicted dehydrogenase